MNPLKWAPEDEITDTERMIWEGTKTDMRHLNSAALQKSWYIFQRNAPVKTIRYQYFDSRLCFVAAYADNSTAIIDLGKSDTAIASFDTSSFKAVLQQMNPGHSIVKTDLLHDYDSYYYNKHRSLPLPVYRYQFNDRAQTCYYVNPGTVAVVKKTVRLNRLNRWLYNGLHSLDFPLFFYKRPLWDITVIVLLLGCTLLSFTGFRLMLKRLVRKFK